MDKTRSKWSESVYLKRLKEGRGQGERESYKPWTKWMLFLVTALVQDCVFLKNFLQEETSVWIFQGQSILWILGGKNDAGTAFLYK